MESNLQKVEIFDTLTFYFSFLIANKSIKLKMVMEINITIPSASICFQSNRAIGVSFFTTLARKTWKIHFGRELKRVL